MTRNTTYIHVTQPLALHIVVHIMVANNALAKVHHQSLIINRA